MRHEPPVTKSASWATHLAGAGWLIRRRFRRRWLALVLLALVVGLGGAGALVSLGAAERTANAYARYVDRADVGDVTLNPDLTDDLDEFIRTLPGVRSVTSDAVFSASLDEGAPRTIGELEFAQAQVGVVGEPVFAMVGLGHPSHADLTVLEGRLPADGSEVAIGSRTAVEQGIDVGDEVMLGGDAVQPDAATVTGRVVFPALGPNGGERAAPGTGLLLPAAMLDDPPIGFIGIGVAPGADPEAVRGDLQGDLAAWDTFFEQPLSYTEPVRPPEIVDTQSMRTAPVVVGGLLVLAASLGLAFAVAASVRSRRRELATLRALGFTGRQVRDSVRVQTVATMIAALVVGAPVGVAVGRVAWRAFASQLGVVTDPRVPAVWILATAAGAVVVALAAAAVPARVATRAEPGAALRSE